MRCPKLATTLTSTDATFPSMVALTIVFPIPAAVNTPVTVTVTTVISLDAQMAVRPVTANPRLSYGVADNNWACPGSKYTFPGLIDTDDVVPIG